MRLSLQLTLVAAGLLAALALFPAHGHAALKDNAPFPQVAPEQNDNGRGDWFRDACVDPASAKAGCGVQVVSNASGTPLASATPPSGAYGPAQFHTGYNLPTTSSASTPPTIAIIDAFDDPSIEADLAAYDSYYHLPACTTANSCFRKVNQTGGTSYPSGTSWHLEIALDVETAHAICQNCKILLVEATSNSFANLGAAVNEAVALGANVISNSYGGGEYSGETSDEVTYFKHPGVVIVASSGDSGYGVEFPAASQYVTAVGGTTLRLNSDDSWKSETAWSGSGSGCSAYEPKPSWQHDPGCAHRTVADVSADADPNTGAAVYDSVGTSGGSAWYQVGGTSLAAPLVGAVYALAGNASVTYGSTPYANASSLHDVTSGSSGSCSPTYLCNGATGFDGPTGLGSPNGVAGFVAGSSPAPSASLSISPSSATVNAGSTATYTVTVSRQNGFSGNVSLSASGLPSGASATFSAASTSTTSVMTVTTSGTTAAGSSTITVTGTGTGISNATATATLTVQAQAQSIALSLSPATATVASGATATYTVQLTRTNFAGSVTLAASGLPTGATASFTSSPTTGTSAVMTIATTGTTPAATSTITVTGTGSGISNATTTGTLTVQGHSVSLGLSPATATISSGATATYTVSITRTNFTGAVTLAASGLPSGATAGFSSSPTTGTSAVLTVRTTLGTTPAGSSTITVTGSGTGSSNATATAALAVQTPGFTITASPASHTVYAGSATVYTVAIARSGGFASSVALSASGLPSGVMASFSPVSATTSSTLTVSTQTATTPGTYTLTVSGVSGSLNASGTATLVVAAAPTLTVSATSVARGSAPTVSWSGVVGSQTNDWIGLYLHGAANPSYLGRIYTSSCAATAGSTGAASGSCAFRLPSTAGQYEFRLFAAGGWSLLATSPITVAS